ncbi:carbohydrate ABC transporter permease [Microlunatus panaciterrae]|uniref:Raffinose/stachyose/melibiose transport system permease protein n=1 Tax=Microlunatus panaciterrae TaxID=400768 RepID=A0ABS2REN3_9ACTN|nr:carbohydrate ABC transporter permease [Microlunatus panaciterrae]MBM7797465.1 raffinose/stachyose/melibiose transport system permease protein [Microlunatus panaciterrae]
MSNQAVSKEPAEGTAARRDSGGRRPEPTPAHEHRPRRFPLGRLLSYLAVLVVMVLYLFPLLFLLNTALKSNAEFFSNPLGMVKHLAINNFSQAWRQGNFGAYMLNSILYTAVAAGLGTFISLLVGFPVSRGYLKHTKLWYGLFVAMLFLPNSLVTQFQLVLRLNLYDTRLGYMLMMAAGVGVGPLLVAGYVKSVPVELDEAAALDGVGYLRYLFGFLPALLKPVLSTIFILQAIGVWNDIILATILLPDQTKSPVTLGLFAFQGTYTSQWSLLSAATIIVAAPLLVAYVFLQRYLVASVVGGAVKG